MAVVASLDPVVLLALDSGGTLGLSEVKFLEEIMHRLEYDEGKSELVKPCERFDLIGGSGTGGLLAVLLGPLQLSVPQAKEIYLKIIHAAFSRVNGPRPPPATDEDPSVNNPLNLIPLLKDVVREALQDEDARMFDSSRGDRCNAFVCLNMLHTVQRPRLIRTYETSNGNSTNYPIWEVLRATLSCPGVLNVFDPEAHTFTNMAMPQSLRFSNPSAIVLKEAYSIFPQRQLSGLVNLGAGHPRREEGTNPVEEFVKAISIDCARAAEEMTKEAKELMALWRDSTQHEAAHTPGSTIFPLGSGRRMCSLNSFYFRLSPRHGLHDFSQVEWEAQRIHELETNMNQYLPLHEPSSMVDTIIAETLIGKKPHIVLRMKLSI